MKSIRKVFWENPYLKSIKAEIVDLQDNEVLFNRTIAYSFAGGQESDKATFNNIPLIASRLDGLNIRYTLPKEHGLSIGDRGIMLIDWERRNKLMRYHMLCELVLAITNRYFGRISIQQELRPEDIDNVGIVKVMARMTDSGAYVDFDHEDFTPHIPHLQRELDRIIDADLPIEKGYLQEATQERYWRIVGLAMIPCGGTHVSSTKEIGKAVLKREKTTSKVTITGKAERIKIKLIDETPTHAGELEE